MYHNHSTIKINVTIIFSNEQELCTKCYVLVIKNSSCINKVPSEFYYVTLNAPHLLKKKKNLLSKNTWIKDAKSTGKKRR